MEQWVQITKQGRPSPDVAKSYCPSMVSVIVAVRHGRVAIIIVLFLPAFSGCTEPAFDGTSQNVPPGEATDDGAVEPQQTVTTITGPGPGCPFDHVLNWHQPGLFASLDLPADPATGFSWIHARGSEELIERVSWFPIRGFSAYEPSVSWADGVMRASFRVPASDHDVRNVTTEFATMVLGKDATTAEEISKDLWDRRQRFGTPWTDQDGVEYTLWGSEAPVEPHPSHLHSLLAGQMEVSSDFRAGSGSYQFDAVGGRVNVGTSVATIRTTLGDATARVDAFDFAYAYPGLMQDWPGPMQWIQNATKGLAAGMPTDIHHDSATVC